MWSSFSPWWCAHSTFLPGFYHSWPTEGLTYRLFSLVVEPHLPDSFQVEYIVQIEQFNCTPENTEVRQPTDQKLHKNTQKKLTANKHQDYAKGLEWFNLRVNYILGLKSAQGYRCTTYNVEMLCCYIIVMMMMLIIIIIMMMIIILLNFYRPNIIERNRAQWCN